MAKKGYVFYFQGQRNVVVRVANALLETDESKRLRAWLDLGKEVTAFGDLFSVDWQRCEDPFAMFVALAKNPVCTVTFEGVETRLIRNVSYRVPSRVRLRSAERREVCDFRADDIISHNQWVASQIREVVPTCALGDLRP